MGKLWLKKPKVTIWHLAKPDYLLEELAKGKENDAGVLLKVQAILQEVTKR
jgi:hypothetical protein